MARMLAVAVVILLAGAENAPERPVPFGVEVGVRLPVGFTDEHRCVEDPPRLWLCASFPLDFTEDENGGESARAVLLNADGLVIRVMALTAWTADPRCTLAWTRIQRLQGQLVTKYGEPYSSVTSAEIGEVLCSMHLQQKSRAWMTVWDTGAVVVGLSLAGSDTGIGTNLRLVYEDEALIGAWVDEQKRKEREAL